MLPLVNGLLSFTKLNYSRLLLTDEIHMLVLMDFILITLPMKFLPL